MRSSQNQTVYVGKKDVKTIYRDILFIIYTSLLGRMTSGNFALFYHCKLSIANWLLLVVFFGGWMNASAQNCTMACQGSLGVSVGNSCTAVITPEMLLTSPAACLGAKKVTLASKGGAFEGNTVTLPYLNQLIFATVTDLTTGNSCSTTLYVEDRTPPQLVLKDITVPCTVTDFRPQNPLIGYPTVTDNCDTNTAINYVDEIAPQNCATSPNIKIITRHWTAIDRFFNKSVWSQKIFVQKEPLANVIFPESAVISCETPNPNTTPDTQNGSIGAGRPTINGILLNETPTNGCGFVALHTDQRFDACGGGYYLVRTWTVLDGCTNSIQKKDQFIRISDLVGPKITCPTNVTVTADALGCAASVTLPVAAVSDNCSGIASVSIKSPFGNLTTNGGTIDKVPIGKHTFIYTATDKCGNETTCSVAVTVRDDLSPVAICSDKKIISLTRNGTATVIAKIFDAGSSDNCTLDRIECKRLDKTSAPLSAFVVFDCQDLGKIVMVLMRVYDLSGNYNDCVTDVEVRDRFTPEITCPTNITIDCEADYSDLTKFGTPIVVENCTFTLTSTDSIAKKQCGEAQIFRRFKVIDKSGQQATCTQTVSVINQNPFTTNDITWASDFITSECISAFHPDSIPKPYNRPVLSAKKCANLSVTYLDKVFTDVKPTACIRILRTWTVIDWCQYTTSDPQKRGLWEKTQLIEVRDNQPPVVISCPKSTATTISTTDCMRAEVMMGSNFIAKDCSNDIKYSFSIDYNSDGSIDVKKPTANASGQYPMGKHFIQYFAEDACGNIASCQTTITVRDEQKPTPICKTAFTLALAGTQNNGKVIAKAKDFDNGSSDNCTLAPALTFKINKDTFTCTDIGKQTLTLTVTDAVGNASTCQTSLDITDPQGLCTNISPIASISGAITMENGKLMDNSTVIATSVSGNISTTTNATGEYKFNNLPRGSFYTIKPYLNTKPLNGVSTFDLVLISKYILGIEDFDSPYKIIAADVTKNGRVTVQDIVELRKTILRIQADFTSNTSWRFIDNQYAFPDPANPLASDFPESVIISSLQRDRVADFVAVKIGDVNGNASPKTALIAAEVRGNAPQIVMETVDKDFFSGEIIRVPMYFLDAQQLLGLQFTLQYNPEHLEWLGTNNEKFTQINHQFVTNKITDGFITANWYTPRAGNFQPNEVAMEWLFKVKKDGNVRNALHFSSIFTNAEAYTEKGEYALDLRVKTAFSAQKGLKIYPNQPNPFIEGTQFRISNTEKAQNISFSVSDITGKLWIDKSVMLHEGENYIPINRNDLGGLEGIFIAHIRTENNTWARKIVLLGL
jgi:HYR domain/Dockerin type I domain